MLAAGQQLLGWGVFAGVAGAGQVGGGALGGGAALAGGVGGAEVLGPGQIGREQVGEGVRGAALGAAGADQQQFGVGGCGGVGEPAQLVGGVAAKNRAVAVIATPTSGRGDHM